MKSFPEGFMMDLGPKHCLYTYSINIEREQQAAISIETFFLMTDITITLI